MRTLLIIAAASTVIAGGAVALAQGTALPTPAQVPSLTCADLMARSSADQGVLIDYVASAQDSSVSLAPIVSSSVSVESLGKVTATTELGTVTVTDPQLGRETSSRVASDSSLLAPTADISTPPALAVDHTAIINACTATPGANLADVIATNGATGGAGAATNTLGVDTSGSLFPSISASAPSTPNTAVSSDLNAASRQLDNSINSTQITVAPQPSVAVPQVSMPAISSPTPQPVSP